MSNKVARASGSASANEPTNSGSLAGMDPAEVHYFNRYSTFTMHGTLQG